MTEKLTHLYVILSRPRGFCAGVVRAIDIVERALDRYGPPIYVRHEIVHNKRVVESLRARGAIFVECVTEIPEGAITVFSAHGVSPEVEQAAQLRSLDVIDATCPLVRKVHIEGRRYATQGFDVVLIGHRGHPEVEGTRGQIGNGKSNSLHIVATPDEVETLRVNDPDRVAFVTQTTLSLGDVQETIDALRRRFPQIVGQDTKDICYATQNRQNAVLSLVKQVDLLLVVGSANSSNTTRLREIGEAKGVPTHMIDNCSMLDPQWLSGVETLGITAGASVPEVLVQDTVARLASFRSVTVEEMEGRKETVRFRVPERLVDIPAATVP
jgi:4-hydroxy-3-methylbut-2-enyl diphosphate reductase